MKIFDQRNGKSNESDRLELAALLIKFGYTVRIGKQRNNGTSKATHFVEAIADATLDTAAPEAAEGAAQDVFMPAT